jgi:3-hydroxyisobutyrate dehydrogenase
MTAVGFIGLGMMGQPLAMHLLSAGHGLVLYARNRAQATDLCAVGARLVACPAEVAKAAEVTFTMVGGPDDVAAIHRGADGLLAGARPGRVLVDLTTSSPELAIELAALGRLEGIDCLDAPVTGGVKGARDGTLTLMVGGEPDALERVRPLLDCFAGQIRHLGPAGAGQRAKIVNQIAVGGIMTGLAEALAYASAAGLDEDAMLATLVGGTARSFLLEAYGEAMLQGNLDAGFFVDHFVKDLSLALDSARRLGLQPDGLANTLDSYRQLAAAGDGRAGIQALIRHYRRGLPASPRRPRPATER